MLDAAQVNIILQALYDKVAETQGYLRSYTAVPDEPEGIHTCCAYHLNQYEKSKRQRDSLLERQDLIRRTIADLESSAGT